MSDAWRSGAAGLPDAAGGVRLLGGVLEAGDAVLVKGSRGVGLELLAEALGAEEQRAGKQDAEDAVLDRPVVGEDPVVLAPDGRRGRR
jgi:hypothetical protein